MSNTTTPVTGNAPTGPKLRYSDAELEEFRAIINEKLAAARSDHQQMIASLNHSDNSADDTYRSPNFMEEGSDELQREETASMAARIAKFIQDLENALLRIHHKTYGICRVTGELIPAERLRLVPHTTLSMAAKTAPRPKD
ncbi:MAG TPA: TraR/DksA C4-type zinc finger protein [Flavobacteriales bacterium]